MPDLHLANEFCVGAVIKTDSVIYPNAIGSDIGCGMAAVSLDCEADSIRNDQSAARIFQSLESLVPTNRHSNATAVDSLPETLQEPLSAGQLEKQKSRDGRFQLGTLGRGNHFVELQADHDGRLWLMVHSGSRGIGKAIFDFHIRKANVSEYGLAAIEIDSTLGRDFLSDVKWACLYAAENRRLMTENVAAIFLNEFDVLADWGTFFQANHNYVSANLDDSSLLIHRKGSQSALNGEKAMIPGSMGTKSFHVEGRGNQQALQSCSHGAGRKLRRRDAAKQTTNRDLLQQLDGVYFDQRITKQLREESPKAYKNSHHVIKAQHDLVKVIRGLTPILSYKGV